MTREEILRMVEVEFWKEIERQEQHTNNNNTED